MAWSTVQDLKPAQYAWRHHT